MSSSSSSTSSSSSSSSIKVKFLVDNEHKRVVFAEAESDFVDLLFSFLVLPLGRIVRLLKKQSGWGSLDNLYKSVECLDYKHFQTEACKEMLLNPRSAAAIHCENLKIEGIHERNPRIFYTCRQDNCKNQSTCYYTYTSKVQCGHCGNFMDRAGQWENSTTNEEVFIHSYTPDFIITNDLQVTLSSSKKGLSLCKKLKIKYSDVLEERVMEFGTKEALELLGRSLISKNVLTEIYFPDSYGQNNGDFVLPIKEGLGVVNDGVKKINFELILNKTNNEVLYAEADDDFVNQLVSFLTFPLGFVLKFHSENICSFGGCIQNLYSSAERMIFLVMFKSNVCRNMLLNPILPTFYGIKNQILELEESKPLNSTELGSCMKCYSENESKICTSAPCIHGISELKYIEQNPKLSDGASDNTESFDDDDDGAFVVSAKKFMVLDNLHISPLSVISVMGNRKDLRISNLVRRGVCIDKIEVIFLMSTMLISKKVFTDVFFPKPKLPGKS